MLLEEEQNRSDDLQKESDEQLLALSVNHPSVFEIIVLRYQSKFMSKAMQVVLNKENAEDIVIDTFTKIYLNAGKFVVMEGASFKSWGYKILLNTCFTHYQKLKKKRRVTTALTDELIAILPDRQARQFEKLETSDWVTSVLDKMSVPFKKVLTQYFIDGKSQAEIAEEENVSVGAIKTRVHRAKEEFKKINNETSVDL